MGVFGNQLGVALGFLIPPLIITGPIQAFKGLNNGKNGTFNGTFPPDFRNADRWKRASYMLLYILIYYYFLIVKCLVIEIRSEYHLLIKGF